MTQLANLLIEGRGVAKDMVEARRWLEPAAKAGDAEAQNLLGVILANGEGVPVDPVQAYVWLLLADRSGFKAAQRNVEILRSRLAAEERTKAEQAAAAWQPSVSGTEK